MPVLEKKSIPEWERKFKTEAELTEALRAEVCPDCGEPWVHAGVAYQPTLDDLLNTPCGCEYEVHSDDDFS